MFTKEKITRGCYVLILLISCKLQAQLCSGAPAANTAVASSTLVCVGSPLTLSLSNTYTSSGLVYSWYCSALSSVGPYTVISGATASVLATSTLVNSGYYTAVITCTNGNTSCTATPVYVTFSSPGSTTVVPYFEGFEGITAPNQLPNCSWSASNLGGTCLTFTNGPTFSGLKSGGFAHLPAGANYFHTNGMQLSAGVIYSTSIWYSSSVSNSQNWTNLDLLIGPNQSSVSAITVTSVIGAMSGNWTNLSGTFSVPSGGIYYLGIRGISNGGTGSPFLYIDDIRVTTPCTGICAANSPTVSISPSSVSVCAGGSFSLTINCSPNTTANISTGATFTAITNSPITVIGTNTLTGCMSSASMTPDVKALPPLVLNLSSAILCIGQTATVTLNSAAFSNTNTINGTLFTGGTVALSPTTTSIYTFVTTNTAGCSASRSVALVVNPNPTVSVSASPTVFCAGETVQLQASGATNYFWSTNSAGSSVNVYFANVSTFSVEGLDINGCKNTAAITLTAQACTGIENQNSLSELKIFPNPGTGIYFIKGIAAISNVVISNLTGEVMHLTVSSSKNSIDIRALESGIYFVRIGDGQQSRSFRIIKD